MTQDELEFLIVQHVDGTLAPDEAPRLAAILASDASARALLAEHERLATVLRAAPAIEVDHDWLTAQIASRIDDEAEHAAAHTLKLPRWAFWAPMAAAAGLMVTLTLGILFHRDDGEAIPHAIAPNTQTQIASVTGPTAERSGEPQMMSVSVGAPANLSPSLVTALFLAEQFPSQGRVIVRPAGPPHTSAFD